MLNLDTYLISLPNRLDRREASLKELSEIDIKKECLRIFDAQYTPRNGAIGCANSHAHALSTFLFESDSEFCMILEDDFEVIEKSNFVSIVNLALHACAEWDVLLLASNVALPLQRSSIESAFRVVNAQTTAAYITRRHFAPHLIKLFYSCAQHIDDSLFAFDNASLNYLFAIDMAWKSVQVENRFVAFLPQLIKQRSSFSEIENRLVSYGV